MKITVIGAGAVGGYFGLRMQEAGHEVTFLVREKRYQQLKEEGFGLTSPKGDYVADDLRLATSPRDIEVCDLVVLAVKGYHLESALPALQALVDKGAAVLPILNGVSHIDDLTEDFGHTHVLGGLAYIIATLDERGHVVHSSSQHDFVFGPLDESQNDLCDTLAAAIEKAGLEGELSADIMRAMWKKYTFITAFSGVTTASRQEIGRVREEDALLGLCKSVLDEMITLAGKRGVDLTDEEPDAALAQIHRFPAEATSSMHQDLRKGLNMEVEHLLGGALTIAASENTAIPHIETLYAILKPFA